MERNDFTMLFLMVMIFLTTSNICSGCLQPKYVLPHSNVSFNFDLGGDYTQFGIQVDLQKTTVLGIILDLENIMYNLGSGVVFIGDAKTGKISFLVTDISIYGAGVYMLTVGGGKKEMCQTVYILGKPTTPLLISSKDAEVGGSAEFTCSSNSTTVPYAENHEMVYNWRFDGQDATVATDSRFSFGGNKMTVKHITMADQDKVVECKATEDVPGGQSSDFSRQKTVNVFYGPENITFSPNITNYEARLNEVLSAIECKALCNPLCSYRWTKDGGRMIEFKGQNLSLGQLDETDAGTYTCSAQRSSHIQTKNLTVNVIYGPLSIQLLPPNTSHFQVKEFHDLGPILCSADCWPCRKNWTGPQNLQSGEKLLIQSMERDKAGLYTCTAANTKINLNATTSISVEVIYGPDAVFVIPNNTNYTANERGEVNDIRCEAHCFPNCSYVWSKQGITLSNNDVLHFGTSIFRNDSGVYTCIASNGRTNVTKRIDIKLNVRYGPDSISLTPDSTKNYTKNEGTVLHNINCTAHCYPTCEFEWIHKNEKATESSGGQLLSLGNLTRLERGVYTCKATNPVMSESESVQVTVNVRYGPDAILLSPKKTNYTVVEGYSLKGVSCSSDCWPGCDYVWINGSSGNVIGTGGNMSLTNTSRYYTGEYSCNSSNWSPHLKKSVKQSIYIAIQYPPDVSILLEINPSNTELTDNITLLCFARGEPDEYTFKKWVHIAPDLETQVNYYTGRNKGNHSQLLLQNVSYMDSGLYRCSVTNNIIDHKTTDLYMTKALNVTIKGGPIVIETSNPIYAAVEDSVMLNVTFYSNDATNPTSTWFMVQTNSLAEELVLNDTEKYTYQTSNTAVDVFFYNKKISQPGYSTRLTIANVMITDFTTYILRINNSIGYAETRIVVSPKGPPEKPRSFHVLLNSESTSSITFIWYPGFHNGAEQTFNIEYRIKGTSEWISGKTVFGGKTEPTQLFNASVTGLLQDNHYEFKIYSTNTFGNSSSVSADGNTTAEFIVGPGNKRSPTLPAVGGTLAAVFITLIIVVVVYVRRRKLRQSNKESPSKSLLKDNKRSTGTRAANDTPEINLNPMYESAGPLASTLDNSDVYTQVDTNRKKAKPAGDIYSQVDKAKKRQTTSGSSETKNDVYARVQKTTHKGKNEDTPKPKKQKPDKKTKKGRQTEGDLYDNVEPINSAVSKGDTVYENPSCSIEDEQVKQMKKQDGLVYAILDLPKETVGKNRKTVIHGLEDRTDYADIKYGEVGEQASESDEDIKKTE